MKAAEVSLIVPLNRQRLVGMRFLAIACALTFVGLYAFFEYGVFESSDDAGRRQVVIMMSLMWLINFVLLPLFILAKQRFNIGRRHVIRRAADGSVSVDLEWHWGSKVLWRESVAVAEYTWVWVKSWDWRDLRLELGVTDVPGGSRYRVYSLSVVNAFGRYRFRPEEVEADKAQLLAWGEQVAELMGLENRGFSFSEPAEFWS
ncbi:MAG: hypothetical protein Q4D91_05455 [Lautropia sp.]|nr:hypothetical protein [Lautropia sp.]